MLEHRIALLAVAVVPLVAAHSSSAAPPVPDSGPHLWSESFGDSPGVRAPERVAFDGGGDVIVLGNYTGEPNFGGGPLPLATMGPNVYVAKFDRDGGHVWSHGYGEPGFQVGYGLAVDVDDTLVLAGSFTASIDFGGGPLVNTGPGDYVFVAKLDPDGNHVWSRGFGGTGAAAARGVALDANGNVVVAGNFGGSIDFGGGTLQGESNAAFLLKLDANGDHLWSRSFRGASDAGATDVAIDRAGNPVFTGTFHDSIDFGGGPITTTSQATTIFLAELDGAGGHRWSKAFEGPTQVWTPRVAVDSARRVALVGGFDGGIDLGGGPLFSAGGLDTFVAKFDAGGEHLWSRQFGDAASQLLQAVTVDSDRDVILSSTTFGGDPSTSGTVLAKLDAAGGDVWSHAFHGARSVAVATDATDDIALTGTLFGTEVDFGGGPLTNVNGQDLFLALFGP